MRYLLPILVFVFIWGCGSDSKPEGVEVEPVKQESVEIIQEEVEGKPSIDLSVVPNLNEKLKPLLRDFFLSKTYIDGDLSELTDLDISLSDNCDKFNYSFQIDRKNLDVEALGTEADVLSERDFIKVDIVILELTETRIKLELSGSLEYEMEEFSYYGGELEWVKMGDGIFEEVEFDLAQSIVPKSTISMVKSGRIRKFSRSELRDFTIDELGYLRNEFYARKGYNFKTEKMQVYFAEKEWYAGETDEYPELTDIELYNIFFIKAMEEEIRLSESNDGSKKISAVYLIGTERILTEKDLKNLNVHQLSYLRNEFFARKGYKFRSKRLNEYFSSQDWYEGTTSEDVMSKLSEIEKQNIEIVRELESK